MPRMHDTSAARATTRFYAAACTPTPCTAVPKPSTPAPGWYSHTLGAAPQAFWVRTQAGACSQLGWVRRTQAYGSVGVRAAPPPAGGGARRQHVMTHVNMYARPAQVKGATLLRGDVNARLRGRLRGEKGAWPAHRFLA